MLRDSAFFAQLRPRTQPFDHTLPFLSRCVMAPSCSFNSSLAILAMSELRKSSTVRRAEQLE
jgi:hypothetical protein